MKAAVNLPLKEGLGEKSWRRIWLGNEGSEATDEQGGSKGGILDLMSRFAGDLEEHDEDDSVGTATSGEPKEDVYVIVQCGCDGLVGDPLVTGSIPSSSISYATGVSGWNLGIEEMGKAVEWVLHWAEYDGRGRRRSKRRKVVLLGGGGYSSVNAARCWVYLTSIAVRRPFT